LSNTVTFQVTPMHCGGCVGRVERALAATPGVDAVAANLATRGVRVEYSATSGVAALAEVLKTAGYPADTDVAMLDLGGLHCASCVGRVEQALMAVEGVIEARVNLASETAHVRYLSGVTSAAVLADGVASTGYAATVRQGDTKDRRADELRRLQRQVLLAVLLALPVFLVEMGGHLFPPLHHLIGQTIGHQTSRILQFLLTTLVLIGPGRQFYAIGYPALFRGAPDMNALVALGTSAAYGYSVIATFAPGLLPVGSRNVYFEAAAVIVVLILIGRLLEARAKGRTGAAIQRLVGLQPKTARVLRDGAYADIDIGAVAPGDLIQVRPGERIATDGEVAEGAGFVDEAMISGEPLPVAKSPGDAVIGGTVNGTVPFTFRATNVGQDTMLAQIVRMVEQAQSAKLPIQGLVDKITLVFVPAVLGLALLTILVWLLSGAALANALVAGVSVLIIACPCAMGLATPTSIMVGTGRAAELGVLFRRGDALQHLQEARVIALDKTGTLTEGRPEVTDIVLAAGQDEDHVLAAVAAAEALSEHPLAEAILRAAEQRGLVVPKAEDFTSLTGNGVQARVGGQQVMVGTARMLAAEGVETGALQEQANTLATQGKTSIYAAIDGNVAGVFGITDPVKPTTPAAIAALQAQGLEIAMITGDAETTAKVIADQLGIHKVVAGVLPDGKVAAIRDLQTLGPVAFVGDGINDAPALAAADIGIAIGTGTDIAVEAADVVLVSGQLSGVINASAISRATMRNIRQNLGWAFGYNILLVPVAAGVLYPFTGLLLSPMLAAGAMALSSVAVVSNALRLRRAVVPAIEQTKELREDLIPVTQPS